MKMDVSLTSLWSYKREQSNFMFAANATCLLASSPRSVRLNVQMEIGERWNWHHYDSDTPRKGGQEAHQNSKHISPQSQSFCISASTRLYQLLWALRDGPWPLDFIINHRQAGKQLHQISHPFLLHHGKVFTCWLPQHHLIGWSHGHHSSNFIVVLTSQDNTNGHHCLHTNHVFSSFFSSELFLTCFDHIHINIVKYMASSSRRPRNHCWEEHQRDAKPSTSVYDGLQFQGHIGLLQKIRHSEVSCHYHLWFFWL